MELLTEKVDVTPTVDDPWGEHHELDEGSLHVRTLKALHDGDMLLRLLAIILLVHQRLGTPDRVLFLDPTSQGLLRQGGSIRVGMDLFFRELTPRLASGQTLGELARWIVATRIVTQHERVAVAKLPDDTFRIRRVGDMIRFFDKDAFPPMNDSRFNALSKMVQFDGRPLHMAYWWRPLLGRDEDRNWKTVRPTAPLSKWRPPSEGMRIAIMRLP